MSWLQMGGWIRSSCFLLIDNFFHYNIISIHFESYGCRFFYHSEGLSEIPVSLQISREMVFFHCRVDIEHVDIIPTGKCCHDFFERFVFKHEQSFLPCRV